MKLYQVDAFTKKVFSGNPAAVCIVDKDLSETEMQSIAEEMHLSETAFVRVYGKHCNLRWFTPNAEVRLCGHATLATAFILWQEGYWPSEKKIEFSTLSGPLFTSLNKNGSVSMDFPATIPEKDESFDKMPMEEELGGLIKEVLRIPNELILIMSDVEKLKRAKPNPVFIGEQARNGVMISGWSDKEDFDFVSRYFAPNLGINEDPVTGFMHTILTPYWSKVTGKTKFNVRQASARGGKMATELTGDRVILTGDAIKVFQTEIDI